MLSTARHLDCFAHLLIDVPIAEPALKRVGLKMRAFVVPITAGGLTPMGIAWIFQQILTAHAFLSLPDFNPLSSLSRAALYGYQPMPNQISLLSRLD
jgi:hypothetical protein